METLFTAVMVVSYVILGLLTIGVIIKIASVYARYKVSKIDPATIAVKDKVVLNIEQEQGEVAVLCAKVENLPTEDAAESVADNGEEA